MISKKASFSGVVLFAAGIGLGAWLVSQADSVSSLTSKILGILDIPAAHAQASKKGAPKLSPVKALSQRNAYYPGTEALAPDEMRIIACGTGMPNARPKQAAACWLVELGNGDKFIFDIGSGSMERLSALNIPMDYLDKVFLGHLHSDHFGDLGALWIGGSIGNRQRPLRVWGPSGAKPELGTAYAVKRLKELYTWDTSSRLGNVNTRGLEIVVHEFDYKGVNKVIYQKNGVTIRSIPAIHALDGPVSYILEWNGLKLAFSSDTYPNKWWLKYAKAADIAIHESFLTPQLLVLKQRWPVMDALNVGTQVHTSPSMFGRVMSLTKPRLAVAYHFFNDFDTAPFVERQIRTTYAGPLALSVDYMVINVTKDKIRVRMAKINEDVWPLPSVTKKLAADPSKRIGFSKFITGGREVFTDVVKKVYDATNKQFGTKVPVPK